MSVDEAFRRTYDEPPVGVWSSPGRVNLIGEHTDYNDGFVLPFAIAARTYVAIGERGGDLVRLRSVQQPDGDVAVRLTALEPGSPRGWAAYPAGVVWALRRAGHDVPGLDVLVDGRVPLGSGLSSSHALECALATAINEWLGLGLDADALARISQVTENAFVGAPTGLMDQLASLRCTRGHALFLDIRTLAPEQVPLDPGSAGLALLVVDTKVHHGHADGEYGDRRAACERSARVLGVPALRDVAVEDLPEALLRLSPVDGRRVRHVVTENARVLETVAALRAGDWEGVGALMDASHVSMRDDYEISCVELDLAVETMKAQGALGARMTGGGFGGSAIAIVPEHSVDAVGRAVVEAFARRGWAAPNPFVVTPSDGARRDA